MEPQKVSVLAQSLAGVLGIVLLASALGGGAAWVMTANAGPSSPNLWDERVTDYVDFVEAQRGLHFESPVWVEFLSEEEFRETVTLDSEDLTDEDEESYSELAGLLRAYGVIDGDVDLFEENNELYGEGVVGYYKHDSKTLTIRGTEITTEVKLTIVHELVHALQDQHFDLSLSDSLDGEAYSAAKGLIEGDARAVEISYLGTLSEDERQAYIDSFSEDEPSESSDEAEADREAEAEGAGTSVLNASLSSSYVLGNGFIEALRQDGGWGRVNSAYEDLPTSMDHLMYPWRYLDGDSINEVDTPTSDDPDASEPHAVGALDWFFILARVMEPSDALLVSDGWGGDLAIDFIQDGQSCFIDNLTGDDTTTTDDLEAAIEQWVDASPDDRSLSRVDNELQVQGCDPGTESSAAGDDNSEDALQLPVVRVDVINSWLKDGATDESAHCAGQWVVTELPLDLLTAVELSEEQDEEFAALISGLGRTCG